MSTARRRLKSPQSLSSKSAQRTMVTLVNIMVMNGWFTSFSFHVNRPSLSWDKAISNSDLETPRSRSWVWSKHKVMQSAKCPINSLLFHFTSIRPTIPEIQLFWNLILKHPRSRSWVRSKVKITFYTRYLTDVFPFRFTPVGPTIPEIRPIECTKTMSMENVSTGVLDNDTEYHLRCKDKAENHMMYLDIQHWISRYKIWRFPIHYTKIVFELDKTHTKLLKNICWNNQVIIMTRTIKL